MKVENGTLIVNKNKLISIGDKLQEKKNPSREYEVTHINLKRIFLKKTKVMKFETQELGKSIEIQTARLIKNGLEDLKRIN